VAGHLFTETCFWRSSGKAMRAFNEIEAGRLIAGASATAEPETTGRFLVLLPDEASAASAGLDTLSVRGVAAPYPATRWRGTARSSWARCLNNEGRAHDGSILAGRHEDRARKVDHVVSVN
jgi:hypothetical protein